MSGSDRGDFDCRNSAEIGCLRVNPVIGDITGAGLVIGGPVQIRRGFISKCIHNQTGYFRRRCQVYGEAVGVRLVQFHTGHIFNVRSNRKLILTVGRLFGEIESPNIISTFNRRID